MNVELEQTALDTDLSPEVVPEKSLRDEINESMADIEARSRDDQGRYAAEDRKAASDQVRDKVAKEQGAPVQGKSAPATPVTQTIEAYPTAWKADHKGEWDKLPPAVRQYITEREQQIHQGFTKADEDRTFGKTIKDVVTPYMAIIQAEGGTPHEAIKSLLNSAYILRTAPAHQKTALVKDLMAQYHVSPQDLFNLYSNNQPQIDPRVQTLEQRLAQIEAERHQDIAARQQQSEQETNGTIADFASQPGHDHFEQVKYAMGVMLANGLAESMEDAYQRAIYADPALRSTMQAQQVQGEQAKRVAEAEARATAARKAGSSVSGSPGAVAPGNKLPDRSLREEIEAQWASANGQ